MYLYYIYTLYIYKQAVVNVMNNYPRSPDLLPFVRQLVFEMPMVAARFRQQWAIVRILKRGWINGVKDKCYVDMGAIQFV